MTLFGWDASDYDWSRGARPSHLQTAKNEGIRFFTHKATEGTSVRHYHLSDMTQAAMKAGIPFVGAYVVPRTGPAAAAQAKYALDYVKTVPGLLSYPGFFWQVDSEHWDYDQVSPVTGEAVGAELLRQSGEKQFVHYAPRWSYGGTVPNPSRPLWSSDYGANEAMAFGSLYYSRGGDTGSGWGAYSGRVPKIWQYGSRAKIAGLNTCDANAFRGTELDFWTMLGLAPVTPTVLHRLHISQRLALAPGVVLSEFGKKLRFYIECYYNEKGRQAELAKLHISSSYRRGDNGYHGYATGQGALDISYVGGRDESGRVRPGDIELRNLASILISNPKTWYELIHSTPFDSDSGYYIKNGVRVPGTYYNEPNYSSDGGHINHVHAAGPDSKIAALTQATLELFHVSKVVYD